MNSSLIEEGSWLTSASSCRSLINIQSNREKKRTGSDLEVGSDRMNVKSERKPCARHRVPATRNHGGVIGMFAEQSKAVLCSLLEQDFHPKLSTAISQR